MLIVSPIFKKRQKNEKKFGEFQRLVYLCNPKTEDSLAQLVEHNTFNVGVSGSSPERVTRVNELSFDILLP